MFGYINPTLVKRRTEYIRRSRWKDDIYNYGEYEGLFDIANQAINWVKGKLTSTPVSTTATTVVSDVAKRVAKEMPVLRRGYRGEYVKILQRLLNKIGYSLSVDGIFGRQTEKAVKSFQSKSGLVPDGIVGAKTWYALFKVAGVPKLPKAPKPTPPPAPKPIPTPTTTPIPIPTTQPAATTPPVKAGILDLLMKNWIWIAIAGSILLTTVIVLR